MIWGEGGQRVDGLIVRAAQGRALSPGKQSCGWTKPQGTSGGVSEWRAGGFRRPGGQPKGAALTAFGFPLPASGAWGVTEGLLMVMIKSCCCC